MVKGLIGAISGMLGCEQFNEKKASLFRITFRRFSMSQRKIANPIYIFIMKALEKLLTFVVVFAKLRFKIFPGCFSKNCQKSNTHPMSFRSLYLRSLPQLSTCLKSVGKIYCYRIIKAQSENIKKYLCCEKHHVRS
jgi:hypothetical protein